MISLVCKQENLHKIKKEEHLILQVNVASKKLSVDTQSEMRECHIFIAITHSY